MVTGSLYTFIVELDGAIWVSHTRAPSHVEAIGTWAKEFDIEPIEGFDSEDKDELIQAINQRLKDNRPSPIYLTENAWSWHWVNKAHTKFLAAYIVKTSEVSGT